MLRCFFLWAVGLGLLCLRGVFSRAHNQAGPVGVPAPGRLNCHNAFFNVLMLLVSLARRPTVWPPVGLPEVLKPSGRGPRGPEDFVILEKFNAFGAFNALLKGP
jgi:hypothetical protein